MKKKILFACDLDNTLIHSLRKWKPGDVCVEIVDGKEWGFMEGAAIPLLAEVMQHVELVPVTTRSIAQYQRIRWPEGLQPRCAATTNGAVLLKDGAPDEAWQQETGGIVSPVHDRLLQLVEEMSATGRYMRCRMVDDVYAFVYSREMDDARETARQYQGLPGLPCLRSGKKVYFFPEGLDKGTAAARLMKATGAQKLICAGDSSIDVPMLNAADLAIAPAREKLPVACRGRLELSEGESFACDVLRTVLAAVEDDDW